ncbi:MAG: hypothetical protein FWC97_10265 [Treponema sp.]|nr:hypothetical protein [Treponema sp.]
MRKHHLKTFFYTVLIVTITLTLGSCFQPVDIPSFMNRPEVNDVVQGNRVTIDNRTYPPEPLLRGNERITGLNPAHYYRVEVRDTNWEPSDPPDIRFVMANGELGSSAQIGRVSGGAITGLDNENTYVVWNVRPINSEMTLLDAPNPPSFPAQVLPPPSAIAGVLSLGPPDDYYFLDLDPFIDNVINYTILRLLPPFGTPELITTFHAGSLIQLEDKGTTTDYIFIRNDGTPFDPDEHFMVLRVIIAD